MLNLMTSFLCGIANDARFIPCLIGVRTHPQYPLHDGVHSKQTWAQQILHPAQDGVIKVLYFIYKIHNVNTSWWICWVDDLAESSWERRRTPPRVLTCSLPLCSHPQPPSDTLWPSSLWLANVQSPPMLTSSLGWALLSNTLASGLQPAAMQPASSLQSRAPQPASTLLFAHAPESSRRLSAPTRFSSRLKHQATNHFTFWAAFAAVAPKAMAHCAPLPSWEETSKKRCSYRRQRLEVLLCYLVSCSWTALIF